MELLEKFGLQVPALTVLVVLVVIFFKLTKVLVNDFRETVEKISEDSKSASAENNTVQKKSMEALGRNSEVLTRFTEVQSEIQFALRELKKTE